MRKRQPWRYLRNVFVALDCLLNALTGGEAFETVSYRLATRRERGCRSSCLLCWLLEVIDPGHCEASLRWHNQTRTRLTSAEEKKRLSEVMRDVVKRDAIVQAEMRRVL